ncbi:MAG: DUF3857 domain-containing protein, partial [Candidatus Omnitrophica bacterium]|nr:DUF3857 domain-containing protein [Candidatus Omnitrophota bacterium]
MTDWRKWLYMGVCAAVVITGPGCRREPVKLSPGELAHHSREYLRKAIAAYERQIDAADDADVPRLALGKLYFEHGMYEDVQRLLSEAAGIEARKVLAMSLYRTASYREALEIFNRGELEDEESRYYHGLTAEKLNLYDEALKAYSAIGAGGYLARAKQRIEAIEKRGKGGAHIRDIDPKIHEIIQAAPSAEEYPQAGALILYCDEEIEVTGENTEESRFHYVVKILNERGKESFSETHISYDSTFERVELLYARTIKPDGTVVDVGKRHLRDVSRYLNFPLYSNVRVFIISFPEVTDGAVIEYAVKMHNNRLINEKDFVVNYRVQSDEPIIRALFELTVPQERRLAIKKINERYNVFGAQLDPEVEEQGGKRIYRWSFKDIPQIIPESYMPASVEINPAIMLSTFESWQQIYEWWRGLYRDKIAADEAVRRKTAELTQDLSSDREKISALYHYCAQRIRYVAVEYGQAGYEPHKAVDIYRNKYGDCKDQAVLLITMLREAGYTAWPVLIATREYYNLRDEFPSVLFNHAIAAVSFEGKTVFLDPTAQTCSFGDLPSADQGRRVLVFKEDSYAIESTPLYAPEHNLVRHDLRISIADDESISADKRVDTAGVYAQSQRYWLLYTQPELIRRALKERIQDISVGATLDDYRIKNAGNLSKPVELSYVFRGPEYFLSAGSLRIVPR